MRIPTRELAEKSTPSRRRKKVEGKSFCLQAAFFSSLIGIPDSQTRD
jgi:hypothetical protein